MKITGMWGIALETKGHTVFEQFLSFPRLKDH